jgi:hypothetical protein
MAKGVLFGKPGQDLAKVVDQLLTIVAANAQLADYQRGRSSCRDG